MMATAECFGAYVVDKPLGEGSFGAVFKVKKDNNNYALKVVKDTDKDALNEVTILRSVQHRNIITYYESFLHEGRLCIVMELATKGTLTACMQDHGKSEKWLSSIGAEYNLWRFLSHMADALV